MHAVSVVVVCASCLPTQQANDAGVGAAAVHCMAVFPQPQGQPGCVHYPATGFAWAVCMCRAYLLVQRLRHRASAGTRGSLGCVCSLVCMCARSLVQVGITIKQRCCGIKHKQFAVRSSGVTAAAWGRVSVFLPSLVPLFACPVWLTYPICVGVTCCCAKQHCVLNQSQLRSCL
jgi:hypothetical protein